MKEMAAMKDRVNHQKISIIQIIIFGISLVLVLVSCSNKHTEWQNLNKSRKFWHHDILKCKNFAETHLARQLDIENDANFNNKTDLQIQFEKYDAVKKFNFHYADCMTNEGYYKFFEK
jgi:hypothetical protein